MSLVLTINSCQKVCVSIPSSCLASEPYTWASGNTNVATVTSNNLNAIIKATYGSGGSTTISILDSFSNVVFVIFLTVTNYLDIIVGNPAYKYIISSQLIKAPPVTGTKATITGPINYFVNPATSGICLIGMSAGQGLNSNINCGVFVPNSTNSSIELYGLFNVVAANVPISFGLFQPIVGGTDIDPLIPYASSFTTLPSNSGQSVQNFNIGILPCDVVDYLTFIMLNETANNRKIIASRYQGGFLQFLFSALNPTTTFTASAIVVPLNYFNASSTSIIYTAVVTINVPTSLATQSVNFTIPSISPDACWFAQQRDIDSTLATSINILRAGNNGATTLTVEYNRVTAGSATFITNVQVIAYRSQTIPGATITFT